MLVGTPECITCKTFPPRAVILCLQPPAFKFYLITQSKRFNSSVSLDWEGNALTCTSPSANQALFQFLKTVLQAKLAVRQAAVGPVRVQEQQAAMLP